MKHLACPLTASPGVKRGSPRKNLLNLHQELWPVSLKPGIPPVLTPVKWKNALGSYRNLWAVVARIAIIRATLAFNHPDHDLCSIPNKNGAKLGK